MTLRDFQALELVTAPVSTPISLTEVKDHLRVEDTDSDALITQMIEAAVSYVDGLGILGKAMVTQTWCQWAPPSPSDVVLKMLPVIALSSVKYYDVDGVLRTSSYTDFEIQKTAEWAIIKPITGKVWPTTDSRAAAIKITFTAGYGAASAVPSAIRQALLMLVAHWFENRESVSEINLVTTPFGFKELIGTFRAGWVA